MKVRAFERYIPLSICYNLLHYLGRPITSVSGVVSLILVWPHASSPYYLRTIFTLYTWVKVFSNKPEFRILRLTFQSKSTSKF